eukprot:2851378-Prymnesium_polylepis.1
MIPSRLSSDGCVFGDRCSHGVPSIAFSVSPSPVFGCVKRSPANESRRESGNHARGGFAYHGTINHGLWPMAYGAP